MSLAPSYLIGGGMSIPPPIKLGYIRVQVRPLIPLNGINGIAQGLPINKTRQIVCE